MRGPNDELAGHLAELAALLRAKRGQRFRVRAYDRAARVVRALPVDVMALGEQDVRRLEGIGDAIAGLIAEYARTGSMGVLDELRGAEPAGFGALVQLPLIGVREARLLARDHGITDLAALRQAVAEPGGQSGLDERLVARIRESLRRVDAVAGEGVPLPLAQRDATALAVALAEVPGVEDALVAGTVRRGVDVVDRYDVVLVTRQADCVRRAVRHSRAVVRILDSDDHGLTIASSGGRQVTLWLCAPQCVGAAMLHATGGGAYVEQVCRHASGLGFDLRPDGLWRDGTQVAGATEQQVLRALSLPFVPPERRDGADPTRAVPPLVEVVDLRGDLHVHSDWSGDGTVSAEQMVLAAAARGYGYVALTDHAENLTINGMTRDTVLARRRTLQHLRERVPGIRILDAAELNIGVDGGIDYDRDFLLDFDFTVASVHSHMDQPQAVQTERILAAVGHPAVNVIGHPSGRIIGHRPGYGIDVAAIAQAAAETGTALEVNGSPRRLDLAGEMVEIALAAGATLTIASDAHSLEELDYVFNAVPIARHGGATPAQVLNCGDTDTLLAFVRRKRDRAG